MNACPDAGLATSGYWKARYALAQEALVASGGLRVIASGSSMLPAIQPGDTLTFRCRRLTLPRSSQVVLFRHEGRLIAHRLRARSAEGHWIIRADSSPNLDDLPVEDADLLGVLIDQRRGGRTLDPDRRPNLLPFPLRWLMLHSQTANRMVVRCIRVSRAWQ